MERQATLDDLKRQFKELDPIKDRKKGYDRPHVKLISGLLKSEIPLNKCEVRKSPVHGRGVFAKVKIDEGELVTIYPAHYIILSPDGRINPVTKGVINSHLVEQRGSILTQEIISSYSFDVTNYYAICGHPDITDNPSFLGHMINDGAKGHSTKKNYNHLDYMLYARISIALSNAMFEDAGGLCVAIIATKTINVDEEILISYGYDYWTS